MFWEYSSCQISCRFITKKPCDNPAWFLFMKDSVTHKFLAEILRDPTSFALVRFAKLGVKAISRC